MKPIEIVALSLLVAAIAIIAGIVIGYRAGADDGETKFSKFIHWLQQNTTTCPECNDRWIYLKDKLEYTIQELYKIYLNNNQ